MAHICQVHPYEAAEGLCRSCGGPFCADCLVYPFGPVKPPYCVPCAVTAGGVRKSARNPTVVLAKENKARLKEWRKARKRDLASPPPDGVATWQKMDEADSAEVDLAAESLASAEREALRLPPPEAETATPPAGVNLAPPGPAGSDWRDEIEAPLATNFGPPGSSFDHSTVAEPNPDALGLADLAFDAPDEPTRWTESSQEDLPPVVDQPRPTPTPTSTLDDLASLTDLAEPFTGPAIEREPFEPTPFGSTPYESTPSGRDDQAAPVTFELPPDLLDPSWGDSPPAVAEPLATFGLSADGAAAPTPASPASAAFDPLPPPPDEATAFEPFPPVAPTAFDPLPSPPPSVPAPDPTPAMAAAAAAIEGFAPPRADVADIPRSAIRPPTPTRIPAAKADQRKSTDAKAMLDRIAALRTDKDD